MNHQNTFTRVAILIYGLIAYASFNACFLYLILFVNDARLPWVHHTLATGAALPWGTAIVVDVALIALFALQHTVMARPAFKRWWTRIVPEPIERSTFVLATVACLTVIMTYWAPLNDQLWQARASWLRAALWGLQGLGWLMVVGSTFLIDHWELFGVRQVIAHFRGRAVSRRSFRTPSLYRIVRHPMMLGMLLGLWATPDMTMSRLAFAGAFTVYVMIGIRIEERDLVVALGDDYRRYQERVPRLLPGLKPDVGRWNRSAKSTPAQ